MFADHSSDQVQCVVDEVAADVLAAAAWTEPPIDALALARRLGMRVARDRSSPTRARLVRLAGGGESSSAILVADEPRPERRQWAVAHEIGESVAHRVLDRLEARSCGPADGRREAIANRLAGAILLPREWFVDAGVECNWDLLDLKAKFATASCELVARRLLDMPPAVIVTMFDQGRPVWRKSNACRHVPPLCDAEMASWRRAHRHNRPGGCPTRLLPPGVLAVRAWPIHEPAWRREFVRTEVADGW